MVSRPSDGFDLPRVPEHALLEEISARISPHEVETWFRNLPIRFVAPDRIIITAANRFSGAWLDRKFKEVIAESARVALGINPLIEILVSDTSSSHAGFGTATGEGGRLPERLYGLAARGPSFRLQAAGRPELPAPSGREESLPSAPINRDFTFSNFVIGPSNRLAHAAALGITEAPGRIYNPLFIYGGVGLGKTHLLHAIVHRLKMTAGLSVTYLTSEAFTNHFISAIERGDVEGFRRSLRGTDVLIVDDVQFLSTKERTQEEFFHTFNSLITEAKQVTISSDCPPREIPGLDERLISRFSMGLPARIEPPGFETRVAIILKKARARGTQVPEAVAEYIAQHIESNIRELEGALLRLISLASLHQKPGTAGPPPITLDLARAALSELIHKDGPSGAIAIVEIQKAVARFYDVKLAELLSKGRARTVSFARQVCMYLARQLTHCSLQEIGALLGGRDHTTVIYSVDKIEKLSRNDPRLKADLELVKNRILTSRTRF